MVRSFKNDIPTILVIFGTTGDLARKKLIPAVFGLYKRGMLPPLFQVVGFSRRSWSTKQYQSYISSNIRRYISKSSSSKKIADDFSRLFIYQQGVFDDISGYNKLSEVLGHKDNSWHACSNKLFYLAVSPDFYEVIFKNLYNSGLTKICGPKKGWTRVIVEKPFGRDYNTAKNLDRLLSRLFKEEQIYRIDHYLGKETVQNILAFRFSNYFLTPVWNNKGIESITIRLLEKEGVGSRGIMYDSLGALRDVGQNHLLQLLALFTMDAPKSFFADSIRKKRTQALESLKVLSKKEIEKNTIRGQYVGFRRIKGVSCNSRTETYFWIKAFLETKSFAGVPMYLESGKALGQHKVEVVIKFRHKTPCLCPKNLKFHYHNVLHYQIYPRERITMSFWVKKPGRDMVLEENDFSFDYRKSYPRGQFIDAYERLLLDAVLGNQTLFVCTKEIMASWRFIDPILETWRKGTPPLIFYNKYSSSLVNSIKSKMQD